jgi:hypothetical protein
MVTIRAPVLELAQEALQNGLTLDQVIVGLQDRIIRDQRYLDRRKRQGQHTSYDDQTVLDCALLALAVCWLMEDTTYHDLLTLFAAATLKQVAKITKEASARPPRGGGGAARVASRDQRGRSRNAHLTIRASLSTPR